MEDPSKYLCTLCDPPRMQSRTNKSRHEQELHGKRPVYRDDRLWCKKCKKHFSRKTRQKHHRKHHPNTPLDETQYIDSDDIPAADTSSEDDLFPKSRSRTRRRSKKPRLSDSPSQSSETPRRSQSRSKTPPIASRELNNDLPHRPSSTPLGTRITQDTALSEAETQSSDILSAYEERCRTKTQEVQAWLERKIEKIDQSSLVKTRFEYEAPMFKSKIIDQIEPGCAISHKEYMAMLRNSSTFLDDVNRRKFVICSMTEAREILRADRLYLPLVILQANQPSISIEGPSGLFDFLRTHETVDIHRYDKLMVEDGTNNYAPEEVDIQTAISLMEDKDEDAIPINFLNLDSFKQNFIPTCLVDLPAYSIMYQLRDEINAGKTTFDKPRDLTNSSKFLICGKTGAMSFPHRDHSHVVTSIFCEFGGKLWPMYPALTVEEEKEWNGMEDMYPGPNVAPFALHLEAGDLLVQPSRRVHAPFSISNVLMTGTMHLYSPDMDKIAATIQAERTFDLVTNEPENAQTLSFLKKVGRLWKEGHSPWPMPERSLLPQYESIVQELSIISCDCSNTCQSTRCACFKADVPCNERCHGKNNRKANKCRNIHGESNDTNSEHHSSSSDI